MKNRIANRRIPEQSQHITVKEMFGVLGTLFATWILMLFTA